MKKKNKNKHLKRFMKDYFKKLAEDYTKEIEKIKEAGRYGK